MPAPSDPFVRLLNNYKVNESTGCWEWQGSTMNSGYGQIKVFGKMRSTHKYSYEMHKGEVPKGLHVIHACDNKICINPDHLRCATHRENIIEARERGLFPCRKGCSGRVGILSNQAMPVRINGKCYGGAKEAERALSVAHGTIRYWLKNKPQIAQIITRKEYENAKQM